MIYDKMKQSLILSSSILTIFWDAHEIPNTEMEMFFKKIKRAKKMIYITDF